MDVYDSSLRLSVDGEKSLLSTSLGHDPAELEKAAQENNDPEMQDQVKRILSKIKNQTSKPQANDNIDKENKIAGNSTNKYPLLRRRRWLFVIAADCYDSNGVPDKKMLQAIQDLFKAIRSDAQMSKISGFTLSTAMPIPMVLNLLKSGKIPATDFDALICSSGSEVYYPGTAQCTDAEGKLCADPDYATHIEYRWGCDDVKRALLKLMNSQSSEDKKAKSTTIIEEDFESRNAYCVSFKVKDLTQVCSVALFVVHLCSSMAPYMSEVEKEY